MCSFLEYCIFSVNLIYRKQNLAFYCLYLQTKDKNYVTRNKNKEFPFI